MISVVVNKKIPCPYSGATLRRAVRCLANLLDLRSTALEINIIGSLEMKQLNRLHRGKNKITDVLSFAWQEDKVVKSPMLGQLYLCYPRIRAQATEYKVSVKEEFFRMLSHGILHLLGYDHLSKGQAKKMFALQEEILINILKKI